MENKDKIMITFWYHCIVPLHNTYQLLIIHYAPSPVGTMDMHSIYFLHYIL